MKAPAAGCLRALLLMGIFWLLLALAILKLCSSAP
jgi:hypothetical protein